MKKNKFLLCVIPVAMALTVAVAVVLLQPAPATRNAPSASNSEGQTLGAEGESPTEEWGSGEVYDGSAPIIRKMGETMSVIAIPHRKQNEKPPMSTEVFATWVGEMRFTVTGAAIYNSIEETGLNEDDFVDDISAYDNTFKPMVVNLTVQNVNAKPISSPPALFSNEYMIASKEEFSPEKFKTHKDGEWIVASGMPLAYADPHSDGLYDYFHYTLDEGKTMEMTLCYYVKIDDIPLNELYLEIATSSEHHRFGIWLDQLKEAE